MPPTDASQAILDAVLVQNERTRELAKSNSELAKSNNRLADATLSLVASASKSQLETEKLHATVLQVMSGVNRIPDVVDVKTAQYMIPVRELLDRTERLMTRQAAVSARIHRAAVRDARATTAHLAVISDNVKDVQRDTGQHKLAKPTPKDHVAVAAMRAFGALPTVAQVLILIALLGVAASGWLTHALSLTK